ncbi:MAG: ATP-binding cassette domain-containing protein [Candidatus Paceibacterota bacterium]|jgi:cell division transport system ATP-binding protein|nr:ATP-binding cassette domain-containing protein [Candidatus Paceibacterota bacterium]MDD5555242.1 ATP-binding cassette domain-containing protein [Candidatus Paceibacterota bacterium]
MIEFKNVNKQYPANSLREEKTALRDVSFFVKEGEFITLCGRSGAGKTTILKLISAEEKPSSGTVLLENQNTADIKKGEAYLLRQKLGFIFQDYKLLSYKTIFENVAYALEASEAEGEKIGEEVLQVLDLVGLGDKLNCLPRELSGGEKQRASIARALIHRPRVILADEPTGNLDPYHSRDIIKILLKINEAGSTVVLSTHSKDIVNALKKRVITLEDGRIIRDEEKGRFFL